MSHTSDIRLNAFLAKTLGMSGNGATPETPLPWLSPASRQSAALSILDRDGSTVLLAHNLKTSVYWPSYQHKELSAFAKKGCQVAASVLQVSGQIGLPISM